MLEEGENWEENEFVEEEFEENETSGETFDADADIVEEISEEEEEYIGGASRRLVGSYSKTTSGTRASFNVGSTLGNYYDGMRITTNTVRADVQRGGRSFTITRSKSRKGTCRVYIYGHSIVNRRRTDRYIILTVRFK